MATRKSTRLSIGIKSPHLLGTRLAKRGSEGSITSPRNENACTVSQMNVEENKENSPPEDTHFAMINQLSEYEILRERNIEERRRLFLELNLSKSKTEAAEAVGIFRTKRAFREKEILPPKKISPIARS